MLSLAACAPDRRRSRRRPGGHPCTADWAMVGWTAGVLTVSPSVPVKTVPELIAYAKANPGKLNFGSAGNGTPMHVSAELFKMMAGVNMVHVPYRGEAPAVTDLLGGQVQVMFGTI